MGEKQKNSKKDRCRKSAQNLRYKSENRREKSHCKRIMRHLSRYGHDEAAVKSLLVFAAAAGTREFTAANNFLRNNGWGR